MISSRRNVSRAEVAKKAGVSPAAVTVALSGRACTVGISPTTRERIRRIAGDLGYTPDILGHSLRKQKSFLIAFLCRESYASWMWQYVQGIQAVIQQRQYSLVIYSYPNCVKGELDCLRLALARRVDGVIVCPMLEPDGSNNADAFTRLRDEGFPVVQLAHQVVPDVPVVRENTAVAGREAVEHLLALGHRRIALFIHDHYLDDRLPAAFATARNLWFGYRDALCAAGLEPLVVTYPMGKSPQREAMDRAMDLLQNSGKPTAVVTAHDDEAFGLIKTWTTHGIRVPEDVSVVGSFDRNPGPFSPVPLTTFRSPNLGRAAAEMLMELLAGQDVPDRLADMEFVIRGSTAPPAGAAGPVRSRKRARVVRQHGK